MSHSADEKKNFFRFHRSHQVTGRAKKHFFFVGRMTHIPPPPSRAGMRSTLGRLGSTLPTSGARRSRFLIILGPAVGCSACGQRAGAAVCFGEKKVTAIHASTSAVAARTSATSCGALAELAD